MKNVCEYAAIPILLLTDGKELFAIEYHHEAKSVLTRLSNTLFFFFYNTVLFILSISVRGGSFSLYASFAFRSSTNFIYGPE